MREGSKDPANHRDRGAAPVTRSRRSGLGREQRRDQHLAEPALVFARGPAAYDDELAVEVAAGQRVEDVAGGRRVEPFAQPARRREEVDEITAASAYFAEIEAGLPGLADKPALIFWALQDQGFPRADLVRFEASFPIHETIELPDANHFFFEDAAAGMIPAIGAFMAAGSTRGASLPGAVPR